MKYFGLFCLFYILLFFLNETEGRKIIQLNQMELKTKKISLSGFESGASAASNFFFSNSKIVSGLALFSAYPYLCGRGIDSEEIIDSCQNEYDGERARRLVSVFEAANIIDEIENVKKIPIFVQHGINDSIINSDAANNFIEFLKSLGADVKFSSQYAGHHPMLLRMQGEINEETNKATGFSTVFNGLKHIFMKNKEKFWKPNPTKSGDCETLSSKGLQSFIQDEYTENLNSSLAKFGDIYIPPECMGGKSKDCSLHIAFHGCNDFKFYKFKNFITCSGYLQVARANNIILLFPKVASAVNVFGEDYSNCWDFFGYSGKFYATKLGPQNEAILKMVEKIMGEKI